MDLVQDKKRILGSNTAKGGFKNEIFIINKFNNWNEDADAQEWLKIMGYEKRFINSIEAIQIPTVINRNELKKYNISRDEYEKIMRFKKADAQIKLIIKIGLIVKYEYISIKKANINANFNQIDKRSVDSYQEIWGFDDEIKYYLKLFTGEIKPDTTKFNNSRNKSRLFFDEMPINIQTKVINFFTYNKFLVISDILKGRGGLSAGWMLVTRRNPDNLKSDFVLKDINATINYYANGDVTISKKGSLKIARIFMQRKGGTPDPMKLQFKFCPLQLFEIK